MSGRRRTPIYPPILLLPAVLVLVGAAIWLRQPPVGGEATATSSPSTFPTEGVATAPGLSPTPDFSITIAPGLNPDWTPDAAAQAVLDKIASAERLLGKALVPPKILSVEAVTGKDVPPELGEGSLGGYPLIWIVRANGTFIADYGPIGNNASASSGYYLFDDAGTVVASGFPLP
jgi:hypothetical protein